ncbi:MAG: 5'/3'-nucleotidase SurE, partial [Gemmatimonadetes bacterium]|nr:5'/3'-nucleotidase SurE [Gemmatimonadota bacterium]
HSVASVRCLYATATLLGLRGIAFSTPTTGEEPDFDGLRGWVARVLETLLEIEELRLVNVNIPPRPRGVCWTRQSVRHYDGRVVPARDPQGREIFWITVRPVEHVEPGTDRWAVEHDLVSITPLRLDLTDERELHEATTRKPLE